MSGTHALVAPSGLYLTMECAFSLLAQLMVPEPPDTPETLEGEAAHWHALQWAWGNQMPVGTIFTAHGKPYTVDIDMVNGAKLYALEAVNHPTARFEDAVAVPDIHPECNGTPDYWRWMPEVNILKVVEYKFGHRYVDAFECWQLIAYALGVARRLGIPLNATVILVVVQPRCYFSNGGYGQEWKTTLADLLTYAQRIAAQVAIALSPNAPARTGKHCLDCNATTICKTLQQGAMGVVEFVQKGEVVELPNDAMGAEARILLEAHTLLEARLKGLKTQIEFLMRAGKSVPYWTMTDVKGKLAWNDTVTVGEIKLLGDTVGVPTIQPPKPITPTQARDAGIDEAVLALYATRGPSGKSLKPESTIARKIFGANKV